MVYVMVWVMYTVGLAVMDVVNEQLAPALAFSWILLSPRFAKPSRNHGNKGLG